MPSRIMLLVGLVASASGTHPGYTRRQLDSDPSTDIDFDFHTLMYSAYLRNDDVTLPPVLRAALVAANFTGMSSDWNDFYLDPSELPIPPKFPEDAGSLEEEASGDDSSLTPTGAPTNPTPSVAPTGFRYVPVVACQNTIELKFCGRHLPYPIPSRVMPGEMTNAYIDAFVEQYYNTFLHGHIGRNWHPYERDYRGNAVGNSSGCGDEVQRELCMQAFPMCIGRGGSRLSDPPKITPYCFGYETSAPSECDLFDLSLDHQGWHCDEELRKTQPPLICGINTFYGDPVCVRETGFESISDFASASYRARHQPKCAQVRWMKAHAVSDCERRTCASHEVFSLRPTGPAQCFTRQIRTEVYDASTPDDTAPGAVPVEQNDGEKWVIETYNIANVAEKTSERVWSVPLEKFVPHVVSTSPTPTTKEPVPDRTGWIFADIVANVTDSPHRCLALHPTNVLCMTYCEHGNVIGDDGCPTCKCNTQAMGGTDAPAEPSTEGKQPLLGGTADLHGCYRTAGYDWCRKEKTCIRLFEQPDGFDYDVDCGDEDDAQYFAAAGFPVGHNGRFSGMGKMGNPDMVSEADVNAAMTYGTKIDPKEDAASPASIGMAASGILVFVAAAVLALVKVRRAHARRSRATYSDLNDEYNEWTTQHGAPPALEDGELDGADEADDVFNRGMRRRGRGASFPETVSDDFMEPASVDDHSPLKIVLPTVVETDVDASDTAVAAFKLPRSPANANDD